MNGGPAIRIAQIAPLFKSVPPRNYGGTERVVSYLTEELVRRDHEVTLFASGDSLTSARLVPASAASLGLDRTYGENVASHVLLAEKVLQRIDEFDLVHSHIEYLSAPLARRSRSPVLTTLHGRLDLQNLLPFYREFREIPCVSISNDQRKPVPWLNWQSTVYHGLPDDLYPFRAKPGKYLAFIGRISPEKRVDKAVEVAVRAGIEIKVAAKVDRADREYFETEIKPILRHPLVEYLGEIGDREKSELLGNACALIFPIEWPEPFGLVMIESLACGTPVIARRCGSVPEILEQGTTGFICDSIGEAVRCVAKASSLSRRNCRRAFEERFTAAKMADRYCALYAKLLNGAGEPSKGEDLVGHPAP